MRKNVFLRGLPEQRLLNLQIFLFLSLLACVVKTNYLYFQAFVALVRMEQEKLRKEQEKEDEERRRRLEEKKRIGRMLEAAFEGDNFAIKTILREVNFIVSL